MTERIFRRARRGEQDQADQQPDRTTQAQDVHADLDDILDEIDSVLEANAAAFVQGFVQKGGQ